MPIPNNCSVCGCVNRLVDVVRWRSADVARRPSSISTTLIISISLNSSQSSLTSIIPDTKCWLFSKPMQSSYISLWNNVWQRERQVNQLGSGALLPATAVHAVGHLKPFNRSMVSNISRVSN